MKRLKKIMWFFAGLIAFLLVLVFTLTRLPVFGKAPDGSHLQSISKSPQYSGKTFSNIDGVDSKMTLSKMISVTPKFFQKNTNSTPGELPILKRKTKEFNNDYSQTRLTWFGHSAFLLEMDGKRILLDPMLGPSAGPFNMKPRFNEDLPLSIDQLPEIDAVLFSHDHHDHLDYSTIIKIKDRVKHFYVPLGLGSHLIYWGVNEEQITELDWWQETQFEVIKLVATPAQHYSGRSIGDRNKTLWASWVIIGSNNKVFFNGDSGYFDGFKETGHKYGPFDICLVECGQYNEEWSEIHMMPEESYQAFIDLNGKLLMPIHWGMFKLAFHSWTEPVERLLKVAGENSSSVLTPKIGESIDFDNIQKFQERWWK